MKRQRFAALTAALGTAILLFHSQPVLAADSPSAGMVSTSYNALNVRSGQSTGSAVVAGLPKGSFVTLIRKSGDWWKVEYADGKYGYCHADYLTQTSKNASFVATKAQNLNVRTGPGTGYSVITSLPKGEAVVILSQTNGWSKILYHGVKTGYVSSAYLSDDNASSSAGAVSLSLPDFKQTDSRWAHVTIGSSGKTIGQIGCTTTALAMMESHRTGKTIYPDAMSRQLTYSSSGDLYWPARYLVSTDGSNLLTQIARQLSANRPVLIGAKNKWGTQHWVVVTGFLGGSLSAGNFTIHDPGSNSRVTLEQFFSAYPNFYKMVVER